MGWRADTKEIIRRYPQHCRDEALLRAVNVTASFEGGRFGHSVSRTTENVATKELPPEAQRELDAVCRAISTTMRYRNGIDRIKLIDLMYWQKRERSMYMAATLLHISHDTAKKWHSGFIELTDAYMRVF